MTNDIFEFARGLPPWAILGFGVLTGSLRSAWTFIYEHTIGYAIARICISLTVEDAEHPQAYLWLSHWIENHLRHRRIHSLLLRKHEYDSVGPANKGPAFHLIPEYGTYYINYKKRLMVIEHRKESHPNAGQARATHVLRMQIWAITYLTNHLTFANLNSWQPNRIRYSKRSFTSLILPTAATTLLRDVGRMA